MEGLVRGPSVYCPVMKLFDIDIPMQRNLLSLYVDYLVHKEDSVKGCLLE